MISGLVTGTNVVIDECVDEVIHDSAVQITISAGKAHFNDSRVLDCLDRESGDDCLPSDVRWIRRGFLKRSELTVRIAHELSIVRQVQLADYGESQAPTCENVDLRLETYAVIVGIAQW